MQKRYIELDLLRTLAIVMMVLYHIAFDLAYLYHWNINVWNGPWKVEGRISAVLFLLLVGMSFAISWHRTSLTTSLPLPRERGRGLGGGGYKKYFLRGCIILSWGLVISLVTAVVTPQEYIRFGILHVIGVAAFLLPLFVIFGRWNIALALWMIGFGMYMNQLTIDSAFLLPLGVPYPGFATLDYYPLLPWFGVILLGYVFGHELYVRMKLQPQHTSSKVIQILSWPGRHSLMIYLLHQPLILGILHMILG